MGSAAAHALPRVLHAQGHRSGRRRPARGSIAQTSKFFQCRQWIRTMGPGGDAARARARRRSAGTRGGARRLGVTRGRATIIATGGMVPRGADAIAMVDSPKPVDGGAPGWTAPRRQHQLSPGTDIAKGETVLRAGQLLLTSRKMGICLRRWARQARWCMAAAVAIISTRQRDRCAGRVVAAWRDLQFERRNSEQPSRS